MAVKLALLAGLTTLARGTVHLVGPDLTGQRVPETILDFGFPPTKVDLHARIKGKKVIIVGLPGAFTPT